MNDVIDDIFIPWPTSEQRHLHVIGRRLAPEYFYAIMDYDNEIIICQIMSPILVEQNMKPNSKSQKAVIRKLTLILYFSCTYCLLFINHIITKYAYLLIR